MPPQQPLLLLLPPLGGAAGALAAEARLRAEAAAQLAAVGWRSVVALAPDLRRVVLQLFDAAGEPSC